MAHNALVHHANTQGVHQPWRGGMMHKCSTGDFLTGAAFAYYMDQIKVHSALKYMPYLSGLHTINTGRLLPYLEWVTFCDMLQRECLIECRKQYGHPPPGGKVAPVCGARSDGI